MRVEKGIMVALGYGKFFRSDSINGLEPIEEGRGPGRRTWVYIQGIEDPVTASRSEGAVLRDMIEMPSEVTRVREQQQLLGDILDTINDIDPMLKTIIRSQGGWDLERLAERINEILGEAG
jgi:hypothetical protein